MGAGAEGTIFCVEPEEPSRSTCDPEAKSKLKPRPGVNRLHWRANIKNQVQ